MTAALPSRMFTYQDLRDRWGVTIRTVQRWKTAGLLKPWNPTARTVRFPEKRVLRFENKTALARRPVKK